LRIGVMTACATLLLASACDPCPETRFVCDHRDVTSVVPNGAPHDIAISNTEPLVLPLDPGLSVTHQSLVVTYVGGPGPDPMVLTAVADGTPLVCTNGPVQLLTCAMPRGAKTLELHYTGADTLSVTIELVQVPPFCTTPEYTCER
jgi:hypothetical protein